MAALELQAKLAILDQALQRLEGELALDEHWRALQQAVPQADAGSAAIEARNTRLRLALETNPVYRAWKNVKEAVDLLRGSEAERPGADVADTDTGSAAAVEPQAPVAATEDAEAPAPEAVVNTAEIAAAGAQQSPEPSDLAHHYELPPEIANLIRAELEAAGTAEPDTREAGEPEKRQAGRAAMPDIPAVAPVSPEDLAAARHASGPPSRSSLTERLSERLGEASDKPQDQHEDEPVHAVPLEAEDLAFLLSPSTSPAKRKAPAATTAPTQPKKPFLERLKAEEQVPMPLRQPHDEIEAEVTVIRKGQPPATEKPAPAPSAPAAATAAPASKPAPAPAKGARLSQLLKAWSRH